MKERFRTKDELFMIRLYEEASKQSDVADPIDRYYIGTLVHLHTKAVNTICNLLARANFIKKHGESDISITPHGINVAKTLTS